jgi:hypothetical protein
MLKKIFDLLFHSCRHKWEIHHRGNLIGEDETIVGIFYHLKCTKCGEMKFKETTD